MIYRFLISRLRNGYVLSSQGDEMYHPTWEELIAFMTRLNDGYEEQIRLNREEKEKRHE